MKKHTIIKATIAFEGAFWTAVFERDDEKGYAVSRKIFGDEPSEMELYEFVLNHYEELKFTAPRAFKLIIKRKNPKRMQREVRREMERVKNELPSETHAQQVLRLELEKNKKIRKAKSKAEREEKLREKFLLRQAKKKKKHKGH